MRDGQKKEKGGEKRGEGKRWNRERME